MADTAALTKSNDSGYIRAKALPQQGVGISFGHLGQAKYQNKSIDPDFSRCLKCEDWLAVSDILLQLGCPPDEHEVAPYQVG